MKVLALVATTLLASTASARTTYFSKGTVVAPFDESFEVPGENPLLHCKDPKDDILELISVDLDPNPPKAGEKLSVKAVGKLHEDVEEGAKVHLQVKYGLITLINQEADICDNVKEVDLACPLKKDNTTTLYKEFDLPSVIPPGKYTVLADLYTKDKEIITCLTATVEFHRGSMIQQKVIMDSE